MPHPATAKCCSYAVPGAVTGAIRGFWTQSKDHTAPSDNDVLVDVGVDEERQLLHLPAQPCNSSRSPQRTYIHYIHHYMVLSHAPVACNNSAPQRQASRTLRTAANPRILLALHDTAPFPRMQPCMPKHHPTTPPATARRPRQAGWRPCMHTYDGSTWSRGLPSFFRGMPVRHGPTPRYMVCTSNDSCFCCHGSKKHEAEQQAQQHRGEHWHLGLAPNRLHLCSVSSQQCGNCDNRHTHASAATLLPHELLWLLLTWVNAHPQPLACLPQAAKQTQVTSMPIRPKQPSNIGYARSCTHSPPWWRRAP